MVLSMKMSRNKILNIFPLYLYFYNIVSKHKVYTIRNIGKIF